MTDNHQCLLLCNLGKFSGGHTPGPFRPFGVKPSVFSIVVLNLLKDNLSLDLAVPSGMSSLSEISWCDKPCMNDNCTTSRWSFGNSSKHFLTYFWRFFSSNCLSACSSGSGISAD